jgi:hypothetical protein
VKWILEDGTVVNHTAPAAPLTTLDILNPLLNVNHLPAANTNLLVRSLDASGLASGAAKSFILEVHRIKVVHL